MKTRRRKPEENQEKILEIIERLNGATIKDIIDEMGWSYQNAYKYLNPLIERGLIFKGSGRFPGITKEVITQITYYLEP